jgi:hypothetical protein
MRLPRVRLSVRRMMVLAVVEFIAAFLLILMRRPTPLSESEAIHRAEQFIAVNGYTDLPPDRSGLVPEPVVLSSSVDEELKLRHDTLETKADGASGGEDGWAVYFRYKHRDTQYRRAVVMDAKGGHIHLMHEDAW